MTTARERMKQLSGLSGAHSAREHFLAITQGTGTGVDRIVFASSMVVSVESSQLTVVRQRKVAVDQVRSTAQPKTTSDRKRIAAVTQGNKLFAGSRVENLYVVQAAHFEQFVSTRPNVIVSNKHQVVSKT